MSQDDDYEVGYGRPPRHTRFQKGRSGNPRGRPKAAKSVSDLLRDAFFEPVRINVNGKPRTIPVLEAILRQMAMAAAKGEGPAQNRVLKILPVLQGVKEAASSAAEQGSDDCREADMNVLGTLAEMMGTDLHGLLATAQEGIGNDENDT